MNALLRKDVTFRWDNDSLRSFEDIKEAITKAPVLVSPDYSRDFIIFSFASQDTIVGVLLQKNKDDYEQPIAFMRKTLRD
jgi:poly(3-hydroxyalkanoate) synthetase